MMELAWQHFRPGERSALDAPVIYEAVYYSSSGAQVMPRLQGELYQALAQLEQRAPAHAPARVVKLPARGS
jgi:hypothetical protein